MTALARAAVGGFGASLGRDIYRSAKKNLVLFVALGVAAAAIALPFIGGRNLVRGHQRSVPQTVFLTCLGSLALVLLGTIAAFLVDMLLQSFSREETTTLLVPNYIVVLATVVGATILGMVVGWIQRGARMRKFAVVKENEDFLVRNGIVETGGSDVTHRDRAGNQLRLLETNRDALVFMIVGRRGKRSFIDLDPEGRMLSYSETTF